MSMGNRFMMHSVLGWFFSNRCPRCKSIDFRTVGTQNTLERTFQWLVQPCRCCLCGRHFYLIRRLARIGETVA